MSIESRNAETGPPSTATRLSGNMGVLDVMFTVLAYNGPAVVLMGFVPVCILLGNGLGTPVLYLAAGLLILVIAAGLLKVQSFTQRPGGFYSIITAGLGKKIGLTAGFGALVTYTGALIAVYALGGTAFQDIITDLFHGPEVPWWIGGIIVFGISAALGYFNISISAKVLYVALGLELLVIVAYIVAVLVQGGAHGIEFTSFAPSSFFSGSLAIGALFAVGLYGGFEATLIFRDEVRDPNRTIPRATYGTAVVIAVSYAGLAWAFINAYGADVVMDVLTENVTDSAGMSVREYVGDFAYYAVIVLLFTSCVALAISAHNILSRYIYNLAADNVLPQQFSVTHPRHRSPHRASMVVTSAGAAILLALIFSAIPQNYLYGFIAGIYSYGMLFMMTLVSFAMAFFLFKKLGSKSLVGVLLSVVFIIMLSILVFASMNFDLLSGLEGAVGTAVVVLIWLFMLSGYLLASRLKKTKPEVYAKIGREEV